MSKTIEAIEITFENIDTILIPVRYFRDIVLGDIHTATSSGNANTLRRYSSTESVIFELDPKVNEITADFEGGEYCLNSPPDFWARLKMRDIAQLTLFYTDKTHEDFYVPWDPEDEYHNRLQTVTINDDGAARVVIGK